MRQSYVREVKELKLTQRFRGRSHSRKKVAKADRRMRTIAGRLVRELLRELPSDSKYREHFELCLKFVNGEHLDGHTHDKAKEQAQRLYGRFILLMTGDRGDRGYRGQNISGNTKIMIPDVPKATDSDYARAKKQELFRKRAGIEPVIGHCKSDHRLGRNFYKGLFGDSINVMLAAAAYNLKRAMRLLLCLLRRIVMKLMIEGKPFTIHAMQAHARSF